MIACPVSRNDASAFVGGGGGRRSATVLWTTNGEYDLTGFNIVAFGSDGARSNLNDAPIGCVECTTGAGHSYSFVIPKHQNVRELFGPVRLSKINKLQIPTGRYPVAPVP